MPPVLWVVLVHALGRYACARLVKLPIERDRLRVFERLAGPVGVPTAAPAIVVMDVLPGFDAVGKLQQSDRLVAVDGEPIFAERGPSLAQRVAAKQGAAVTLTVRRQAELLDVTIQPKLAKRPDGGSMWILAFVGRFHDAHARDRAARRGPDRSDPRADPRVGPARPAHVVTLADRVHVSYPGTGGYPADYDGRKRPRYTLAANATAGDTRIRWGNPFADRYGHGLLLPPAMWRRSTRSSSASSTTPRSARRSPPGSAATSRSSTTASAGWSRSRRCPPSAGSTWRSPTRIASWPAPDVRERRLPQSIFARHAMSARTRARDMGMQQITALLDHERSSIPSRRYRATRR